MAERLRERVDDHPGWRLGARRRIGAPRAMLDAPSSQANTSRRRPMPTYVLLTTLTPEGRETLHKTPDRLIAVNSEIEALGCKLIAQYALLGAYDFLNIIE